jgi:integrase
MVSRSKHRLTAAEVKHAKEGTHHDGGGLYLRVKPGAEKDTFRRRWMFRYWDNGKDRWMGLGSAEDVSLKDARDRAEAARRLRAGDVDPIHSRRAEREAEPVVERTFTECAQEFIEAHEHKWKNPKHRLQWRNTLATHVYPTFGDKSINEVTRTDIIGVLKPIWYSRTETAERLRSRILMVMEWAVANGYRTAQEDPSGWRRHLLKALPSIPKTKRVRHHPAMPYEQVPKFVAKLRVAYSVSARALEFLILTAARTSEVLEAQWSEFDLDKGVWTVPTERMKSGREHRVPLCARAIEILIEMKASKSRRWVFVSPRTEPLSNMALLMMVRRTTGEELTTHGFRSSFRDWAAEETPFSREVAEQALAHVIADKTEAAYRRGDMFEKRRQLMDAWAAHCETNRHTKNHQETVQQSSNLARSDTRHQSASRSPD